MGSHRSHVYQPLDPAPKRPVRRSVQLFVIEWMPVLITLLLASLIGGMLYQMFV
jgi:hypothetical protein